MSRSFDDFAPVPFRRHDWPSYDVFPADLRSRTTGLSTDALALLLLLPAAAWEVGDGWVITIRVGLWLQYAPVELGRARTALEELAQRDLAVWGEGDGLVRVGFPFLHKQLAAKKRGRPQRSSRPSKNRPLDGPLGSPYNSPDDRPVDQTNEWSDHSAVDRPPPSPAPSPPPASSSAPAPAPAVGSPSVASLPQGPQSAGADCAAEPERPSAKPERRRAEILAVIAHYRTYHPKAIPNPRPRSIEWRNCRDRLEEGFGVDDLKLAIDGIHLSPWHTGKDPKSEGKTYLDLDLALRDASQVTKFIEIAQQQARPGGSDQNHRTVPRGARYLPPKYAFRGEGGSIVAVIGAFGGYALRGSDGLVRVFDFTALTGLDACEVWCQPADWSKTGDAPRTPPKREPEPEHEVKPEDAP